jgi:hypothetical protein
MSRRYTDNLSLCPALVDYLCSSLVLRYLSTLYPFPGASLFLVAVLSWCQHFPGVSTFLVLVPALLRCQDYFGASIALVLSAEPKD